MLVGDHRLISAKWKVLLLRRVSNGHRILWLDCGQAALTARPPEGPGSGILSGSGPLV